MIFEAHFILDQNDNKINDLVNYDKLIFIYLFYY
jgi:hypothetical protein